MKFFKMILFKCSDFKPFIKNDLILEIKNTVWTLFMSYGGKKRL